MEECFLWWEEPDVRLTRFVLFSYWPLILPSCPRAVSSSPRALLLLVSPDASAYLAWLVKLKDAAKCLDLCESEAVGATADATVVRSLHGRLAAERGNRACNLADGNSKEKGISGAVDGGRPV